MPEYRLYYNPDGTVKTYAMQDLPGDYIVVDKEIWAACRFDIVVVDGRIRRPNSVVLKMQKSNTGIQCNKYDINILDEHSDSFQWSVVAHERR